MKRRVSLGAALAVAALAVGCVDQRYTIRSDPPGAMVVRNGVPIGPTPVDDHFVYYGKYHFQLIKDGYETLNVDQEIPAPWYEYPPLDFVNEVLNPCQLRDVREFYYQMQKVEQPSKEDVLQRGQMLRERGQSLVGQQPPPSPPALPAPIPALGPPQPAVPQP